MTTAPRRRIRRLIAMPGLTLGIGAALATGCCQPQPYYVPVQPGCPPVAAAAPAAVRYGEVCEAAPADAAPSTVARSAGSPGAAPSKATPEIGRAPRPRVVVSEPSGRLAGRSGWRRSDPENIATRVEGTLDDDAINR